MSSQHHLLTVWNPFYADDAMEAHLGILLESARAGVPEPHVWWGKVRSKQRRDQTSVPRDDDILELEVQLLEADADREIHLYLTDYRSLYVAHVGAISREDVRTTHRERVPAYYAEKDFACDCWFKLLDVQRLATDLVGVGRELHLLRNVHFDDKPVSLYGGMYDLPLVVTRADGRRFFRREDREQYIDGRLWAQVDAERSGGHGAMEADLRDNVLGEKVWSTIDPRARAFLAAGEADFRLHRHDPGYDFSPVIVQFSKALEVHVNALLRAVLATAAPADRTVSVGSSQQDLFARPLTIRQLATALERDLRRGLPGRIEHAEWLTKDFAKFLSELSNLRNPAAHHSRIARQEVASLRDRLLGIGSEGMITRLARAKPKC